MKKILALLAILFLSACGEEVVNRQTSGAAPAAPLSPIERGRMAFNDCGACHTVREDDASRIGPNLYGVFDRRAGAVTDFAYSAAFRNANLVWDEAALDAFLAQPQGFLRGNRMSYPGEANAERRADLIAYLKSLSPDAN